MLVVSAVLIAVFGYSANTRRKNANQCMSTNARNASSGDGHTISLTVDCKKIVMHPKKVRVIELVENSQLDPDDTVLDQVIHLLEKGRSSST